MALAAAGALEAADWLTLTLRSVPGAPAIKNGARLRALFGTQEVEARLRLLDRDVLEPGEACFAQLRLPSPAAIPAGEHLILRRASPAQTMAGGRVLEPEARRLRRQDGTVLDWLELLRDGSPEVVIAAEVARAGAAGTTVRHLARLTALAPKRVEELLQTLPVAVGRAGAVEPQEAAQSRRRLTMRPDPERACADAERASEITDLMQRAGLTPPLPKELIVDASSHRAIEMLLRDGTLIRAVDRDKGKELLFHRDAVATARQLLAPLLGAKDDGGMLVSEICSALGVSRKFCMPLLDHLDMIRFTRRAGDRRVAGTQGRQDC
jgi:selenocysteine-specific elongation factor